MRKDKRHKCGACKALKVTPKTFTCSLGVRIEYTQVQGLAVAPRPLESCFKPRTQRELKEVLGRQANQAENE